MLKGCPISLSRRCSDSFRVLRCFCRAHDARWARTVDPKHPCCRLVASVARVSKPPARAQKAGGETFAWLLLTAERALTLDAINCLMPNASNLEMTVVAPHRRN